IDPRPAGTGNPSGGLVRLDGATSPSSFAREKGHAQVVAGKRGVCRRRVRPRLRPGPAPRPSRREAAPGAPGPGGPAADRAGRPLLLGGGLLPEGGGRRG